MRVLIVDGANVVGSRPDGWWRDRAGAARRLHDAMQSADLEHDDVVLVLEGAARRGPSEGVHGGVCTVHAAGEGDDTIMKQVETRVEEGDQPVVVTADRALRAQVAAAGGDWLGPGWLLDKLR